MRCQNLHTWLDLAGHLCLVTKEDPVSCEVNKESSATPYSVIYGHQKLIERQLYLYVVSQV